MTIDEQLQPGRIWLEHKTNRYVKILDGWDDVPAWTYCDAAGNPEPHGYEPANGYTYGGWCTHRCDLFDFVVYKRFKFVR